MAEEDIVEEMFNNLIDDEEDDNQTPEPYVGEINEETEQTEAFEKDAEITQENAESVGIEEEPESVEIASEDNSEDPETQQEQIETPFTRRDYGLRHPRKDLVFLPGTGGNFFATMMYDQIHNMYVGSFNYDEKINEYSVSQSMGHLIINGDSRQHVVAEIKKIPQRLEQMRDYISKVQDIRGHTDYDWIINEIDTILSVAHRLTVQDTHYIAFSDFLISKNGENFTLEDEQELMGKNTVGEFYDNLHDLFYQHLNAHAIPYMTDICHTPYHINTFKSKPLTNYEYGVILADEQILYTTALMKTKHLLRKKEIKDEDVLEIRHFIETHLQSKIKTYEYITERVYIEMTSTGANDERYAKHFYYNDLIINVDDTIWGEFYDFYGYSTHYWQNKNKLLDRVHEYHEKNINLLLNFATRREIEFMINPKKRIRGV